MTGLFIRTTTEMITRCRWYILNFKRMARGETGKRGAPQSDDVLWEEKLYPPDELIPILQSCIDLNSAY
jgi:hypothetical protein